MSRASEEISHLLSHGVDLGESGAFDLSAFNSDREDMITHPQRNRLLESQSRFDIVPAGRRSGKTVEARHRLIFGDLHTGGNHNGCLCPIDTAEPIYVYCAPTYAQAKRISWSRFKQEIPAWAIARKSESDLEIEFVTGAKLMIVGMDKPERLEGIAIHGIVLDEYADMKPGAWTSSIRPALSTRGQEGWALFIGRPRGKNHFYAMKQEAEKMKEEGESWDVYYPWPSWMVMSDSEILAAKRELDERAFKQEYGGEFLDSGGRACYQFGDWNIDNEVRYDPNKALQLGFDFNVSPGIATVSQDMEREIMPISCRRCNTNPGVGSGRDCMFCGETQPFETVTAFIGEVYIPEDSNTRMICERLIEDWSQTHIGPVVCYGDASGGSRKTSSERSDWQIIEDYLSRHWHDFTIDVAAVNPLIRDKTVCLNSRLKNALGDVRVLLNPNMCPKLIEDLDLTELDQNGNVDPGPGKLRGHMIDAMGYVLYTRFGNIIHSPAGGRKSLRMTSL